MHTYAPKNYILSKLVRWEILGILSWETSELSSFSLNEAWVMATGHWDVRQHLDPYAMLQVNSGNGSPERPLWVSPWLSGEDAWKVWKHYIRCFADSTTWMWMWRKCHHLPLAIDKLILMMNQEAAILGDSLWMDIIRSIAFYHHNRHSSHAYLTCLSPSLLIPGNGMFIQDQILVLWLPKPIAKLIRYPYKIIFTNEYTKSRKISVA